MRITEQDLLNRGWEQGTVLSHPDIPDVVLKPQGPYWSLYIWTAKLGNFRTIEDPWWHTLISIAANKKVPLRIRRRPDMDREDPTDQISAAWTEHTGKRLNFAYFQYDFTL